MSRTKDPEGIPGDEGLMISEGGLRYGAWSKFSNTFLPQNLDLVVQLDM